jgi:hypothetical protein
MLEQMRRKGASTFIYLLFGALIVGLIVSLVPSTGQERGCSVSSNTVIKVDGAEANQSAYLIAFSSPTNTAPGRQKVYMALDSLVRRELLAQAAEQRGIVTTGDLIDRQILEDSRGYFYVGGRRYDATAQFFDESDDKTFYNNKRWKNWIAGLNVPSTNAYKADQARGLQAAMMGELLAGSVRVSREEALADYLYNHNTVTYDVVAFESAKYRNAMRLGDADKQRFLADHGAEVKARFTIEERTYKGVKPELALRAIFIPKTSPAEAPADDQTPADTRAGKPGGDQQPGGDRKPAAGAPAAPRGLPIDVGKARLEAARAAIVAGTLTFSAAEKQLAAATSETETGDRGWRKAESAGLGDKKVDDAVKPLKPGELTAVIDTERGVYLVTATDKREGDLTFDQVKLEIAEVLAKEVWSQEAAKRAALDALAKAQASGGKTLEQLYEADTKGQLTPEQRQQILEQLKNPKHGSLAVHEEDVPVAWSADADGSSGTSSAPVNLEPSKDVLPAFGEVARPAARRITASPRRTTMDGLGNNKQAINAMFDELAPGELAKKVYEGDSGSYVLVQLKERSLPTLEDFDKTAELTIRQLQEARGQAAVQAWLKDRCDVLTKAGKIKPAPDRIRETDDEGKPTPVVYKPCMYFMYL